MRSMDHGRRPAADRAGTAEAGERDTPVGVSIPVLLLPEGVLLEGLDAGLLTNPAFDPDAAEDRPSRFVHRIAAALGRVWHRQWEF
jgi:hypothetical protein